MVQRVSTVAFEGIEARAVDVQVQVAPGLPAFKIVETINRAHCLSLPHTLKSHQTMDRISDSFWLKLNARVDLKPIDRYWLEAAYAEFGSIRLPLVATTRNLESVQDRAKKLARDIEAIFTKSAAKVHLQKDDIALLGGPHGLTNRQVQDLLEKLVQELVAANRRSGLVLNPLALLAARLLWLFCKRQKNPVPVPRSWPETVDGPRVHEFVRIGLSPVLGYIPDDPSLAQIGNKALQLRQEYKLIIDDIIDDLATPDGYERD